ncbi:unnamed protein product [Litomosoides sigmodontis]|uniref:Uncharacterized protein n=1 Tax=Litomosoides sigmodontis TaxID=42156 RepID=A0A3P6TQG3_LITSI|nr:unnamed protein product [Litomosoides sigmodontis]
MTQVRRTMEAIIFWERHHTSSTFHSLMALFILSIATTTSKAVTETQQIYGMQNKLLDETQFSNPKSFDYNFEDDFKKMADKNDVYDELVPYLPSFILHKNGKDAGRTSVPIITRKMPFWSTPSPRQKYVAPYRPFSDKSRDSFQRLSSGPRRPAPLIAKPISQRLNDFTRRLSRSRSSLSGAVMKSKLAEQFSSKKISSKTVISSVQSNVAPKPLIIHTGNGPYLGPKFNCKVLTPKNDGRPSPFTNKTCLLEQPGISADGKCRCTYVVTERDSNGCALGFSFTCLPK